MHRDRWIPRRNPTGRFGEGGARRARRYPYRRLSEAISARRPEQLAFFAFDLLHLDDYDLRRCPIEGRKALLRDVIGGPLPAHRPCRFISGVGRELFEAVRQLGAEGIVSKRRDSSYRGGERRDWVKVKVFDIGHFVVIGFTELGPGRLEAVHVADRAGFFRDGVLIPVIPGKALTPIIPCGIVAGLRSRVPFAGDR